MSRNAKRTRIQIVNPPEGCQPSTSLDRARRYVRRGTAVWDGPALRFLHRRRTQAQAPNVAVADFRGGSDSGMRGFLPYPMPSGDSGGIASQFPALARQGAGL